MKSFVLLLPIAFSVLFVSLTGCGEPDPVVETPDSLTIYSIDGLDFEDDELPKTDEEFKGYPVLGKVEIKDAEKRKKIMESLRKGIRNSDGKMAKCFLPRHGIIATKDGKTTEYVICFECLQLKVWANEELKTEPTTTEPKSLLNDFFNDSGVKIAPSKLDN